MEEEIKKFEEEIKFCDEQIKRYEDEIRRYKVARQVAYVNLNERMQLQERLNQIRKENMELQRSTHDIN